MDSSSNAEFQPGDAAQTVGFDSLKQLPGRVALPPLQNKAAVSLRHEVNPAIALNLLKDIQSLVTLWQDRQRQLVQSLRRLNAQGPMVDGWLESAAETDPSATADAATILRHGDTDTLMQYVEALDARAQAAGLPASGGAEGTSSAVLAGEAGTQYRLCCLDDGGQVRSQNCPPEQMGVVSLAIARYQKYKQLTAQKQAVEAKLQTAVAQLEEVRMALQPEAP